MLDFAQLKTSVPIERVLSLLGITLKSHGSQMRGSCPLCKSTDQRAFVVTPAKNLWYCFKGCGGGDQIKLVSKMRGCDVKAAAQWIAGQCGASAPDNSPRDTSPRDRAGFDAAKYKANLDPAHPSLEPLGVAPETLGVG
jgi:DNA primase